MKSKAILSQTEVGKILAAARTEAQNNQWPVTIVVVDDGGHPLALERLDGAAPRVHRHGKGPNIGLGPARIQGL